MKIVFTDHSFVAHFSYVCFVFVMLSCLFIGALWSPAGKGLASWLSGVMFLFGFLNFSCGVLGIVSIPDLCLLNYFSTRFTIVL